MAQFTLEVEKVYGGGHATISVIAKGELSPLVVFQSTGEGWKVVSCRTYDFQESIILADALKAAHLYIRKNSD